MVNATEQLEKTEKPYPGSDVRRLHPACISCLLRGALKKNEDGLSEERRVEYQQRILQVVAQAPATASPSELVREFREIQKEYFAPVPSFRGINQHFNRKIMALVPTLRERIRKSGDPLAAAIRFAISGNYIDYGTTYEVEEEMLDEILAHADEIPLREDLLSALRKDLEKAKTIAVLHDNCGEIMLDKLLMEEIQHAFPRIEQISVVRGAEVKNDVTFADAEEVGLQEVARVISNGDNIGGTVLGRISDEAREALYSADLIFSKGQANFETLHGCCLNIYYLFLCKCEFFSTKFRVPQYTGMLVHESEVSR